MKPVCKVNIPTPAATRWPLLGQQGQGDAARQQSLAEGILGDGRSQPIAPFRQGLKGAGRGVHAVVTGVLGSAKLRHICCVTRIVKSIEILALPTYLSRRILIPNPAISEENWVLRVLGVLRVLR